MAGYKETPRQKMISMMYLVLTALLALNVSKEALDAFIVVNESVELTNQNFSKKLNETYAGFNTRFKLNQTKVKPFWDKALEAKTLSNKMVTYIENLKYELIAQTEGISPDSAKNLPIREIENKDNYAVPTHFFMGDSDDGSKGKSGELKNKIDDFRENLLNLLDQKYQQTIKLGLETNGKYMDASGQAQNWQAHNFYYTILAADITILNKIITEVHNAEFDVVNILLNAIDADDFKYDKIDAKVLSESNYIFMGGAYKAEIIVAAYDTSQVPEVYLKMGIDSLPVTEINDATPVESQQGKIRVAFPANLEGKQKYAGIVRVKTATGDYNNYHFSDEYIIARPALSISITNMNVFYAGIENKISISVPGIPDQSLIASISCGTLRRDTKSYDWLVNVPLSNGFALISVSANQNGIVTDFGTKKYRIKQIPDPVAIIANRNEGRIRKEILMAAGAITPKISDDFEYDLSFEILSFQMTIQRGFNVYHFSATGGKFTSEMVEQIAKANNNQTVLFDNIIARGPDGVDRPLSPIFLTIE